MELKGWHYFIAVAEELHFGRAAARLGVDQATLSRKIKEFEHVVKAQLFERSHRGTVLTNAGRSLLPNARLVVESWDRAMRSALEVSSGFSEGFKFGVCSETPVALLAQLMGQVRRQLSRVEIQPVEGPCDGLVRELKAKKLGLVFALGPVNDEAIEAYPLWRNDARVLMPSCHALSQKDAVTFKDLSGVRVVLSHRKCSCGYKAQVDDYLLAISDRLRVQEAAGMSALQTLVRSGYGLGIVSSGVDVSGQADFVVRPLEDQGLGFQSFLLCRKEDDNRIVKAFIELARRSLSSK